MSEATASKGIMLLCVSGPDKGKRIAVKGQPATIGKSSVCELASDDVDVAERHVALRVIGGRIAFHVAEGSAVFVDGERASQQGQIDVREQLRVGRSIWQIEDAGGDNDFSTFLGNLGDRISEVAGAEKIEGFKPAEMFSEVLRKRTDEELEHYFAAGTPTTTPPLSEVSAGAWPKPWLFFKVFTLVALVYLGFLFAYNRFNNDLLIPGLLTMGSFAIPFTLLILFFEVNVLRNVPLYQLMKLLFLGGVLSLVLSLFLFELTKLSSWLGAMSAGLVEETGKAAALLLVINKLKYRWTLNGLLLGAAVGAGFAAFESAGYALLWGLNYGREAMLSNIITRGLLSICGGHTLWTALVGAALWRVRGDRKFEWEMLSDPRFIRGFGLCVGMHMIWNAPIHLPLHLKYLALGFVVWVALLSYIQLGLRQVREAQAVGATEFFRQQAAPGGH